MPEPGTLRSGARRAEYPATPEQEEGDVELDSSSNSDLIHNYPMRPSTSLGMSHLPDGELATSVQAYEHSVTPSLMPMSGPLPDSDSELPHQVKNVSPPTMSTPSDHHALPDNVETNTTVGANEINTLLKVISAQQKQIDKLLTLHASNAMHTGVILITRVSPLFPTRTAFIPRGVPENTQTRYKHTVSRHYLLILSEATPGLVQAPDRPSASHIHTQLAF